MEIYLRGCQIVRRNVVVSVVRHRDGFKEVGRVRVNRVGLRKSCLRLSFRSASQLFDSCNTRVLFGKVGNAPCPSQAPFMSFGNPFEGVGGFSSFLSSFRPVSHSCRRHDKADRSSLVPVVHCRALLQETRPDGTHIRPWCV